AFPLQATLTPASAVQTRPRRAVSSVACSLARSRRDMPCGHSSDRRRYLHSCSILSSAWARPLSEYWSVDCVPRPEVPFTVRSAPLRMASTMRASSATFLIQAPSFWVYIANLAGPISAVASEVDLNGYPMMTDTSFFTLSVGRVETNRYEGPRVRPAGSNVVVFGFASAKQTLLPPGEAVYAPQSAYWPSRVGCTSPPPGAGAAAVAAGLAGVAAGFAGAGALGAAGAAGAAGFWGGRATRAGGARVGKGKRGCGD